MSCRDYNVEPCYHCIDPARRGVCACNSWYTFLVSDDIRTTIKEAVVSLHPPAVVYIRAVLKADFPEHAMTFEKLLLFK